MTNRNETLHCLRETDPDRLETLWRLADQTRRRHVGDEVHLRGLLEISNHCARSCAYCGIRADNRDVERYRMSSDEILEGAHLATSLGYGTVVMQAGEDYGIGRGWLAEVIRRIKAETPLAVTLSMGERPEQDLEAWRRAGADRYLLRFETSDPDLYRRIHPDLGARVSNRIAILKTLRSLGYETGSGVMIGIPGQTFESLARDLELFRELDLDMVGVGPWIPHPATPLGVAAESPPETPDQPLNSELMGYKMVALTRLHCPEANIPSTTALATLNHENGRELGLQRGANVVMPNLTPARYRRLYEIYPAKACVTEDLDFERRALVDRIMSIGRRAGTGPGGRRRLPAAPQATPAQETP